MLRDKLLPHADTEHELNLVLDELEAKGFLSDTRFAQSYVRTKGQRYGALRLKFGLREAGVNDSIIEAELAAFKSTELQQALMVWARRFSAPPESIEERARQERFLIQRGFPPGTLRRLEANGFADSDIS
jgi:regulatory protein